MASAPPALSAFNGSWDLVAPATNRSQSVASAASNATVLSALLNVTGLAASLVTSVTLTAVREGPYLGNMWVVTFSVNNGNSTPALAASASGAPGATPTGVVLVSEVRAASAWLDLTSGSMRISAPGYCESVAISKQDSESAIQNPVRL